MSGNCRFGFGLGLASIHPPSSHCLPLHCRPGNPVHTPGPSDPPIRRSTSPRCRVHRTFPPHHPLPQKHAATPPSLLPSTPTHPSPLFFLPISPHLLSSSSFQPKPRADGREGKDAAAARLSPPLACRRSAIGAAGRSPEGAAGAESVRFYFYIYFFLFYLVSCLWFRVDGLDAWYGWAGGR